MPSSRLYRYWSLALCLLLYTITKAQPPLPFFEVRDIGSGRIVISWFNQYPYTAQISIQRSFDSLRGYKSILTVPDPGAVQNGFADTKAVNDHMFYRLYILLDKGQYFFTKPQQPKNEVKNATDLPVTPALTTGTSNTATIATSATNGAAATTATTQASITSAITDLSERPATNMATSQKTPAADDRLSTPELLTDDSAAQNATRLPQAVKRELPVVIRIDPSKMGDSAKVPFTVTPQNDPDAYAPSLYVYAQSDGNIRIDVPNKKRYSSYRIRFYEPDKQFLFELKQLPAASFQLDKTNFLHSGWFLFELYEDTRLIERHKVLLEKDF